MGKTGRNDPCPCGSGRKYKQCCGAAPSGTVIDASAEFELRRKISEMESQFPAYHDDPRKSTMTLQETLGKPNAATSVAKEMRAYLDAQDIKTDADMDRAMDRFRDEYNARGLDEFLGLSPEQMLAMSRPPIKEFQKWIEVGGGTRPQDIQSVPLLRQACYLLERLESDGAFTLTASGYLPPAFAKEWFNACFLNEDPKLKACIKVRGESDYLPMSQIVAACEEAGLAEAADGRRFATTENGSRLLRAKDLPGLYNALFFGYLDAFAGPDWPGVDRLPRFAQSLPLFFCNVLRVKGDGPFTREELEGILRRAFEDLGRDEMFCSLVAISGCILPAQELGLIEIRPSGHFAEEPIRRTEFYSRAIRWK